ncbi:hypothetical protein KIN20_022865 [Parelaphostrongylus tenuis]|uniref:Uncharacterized protein n=1 Tax=Parelaphostrongylus tenuis TaxID=148309 RepID=A0AAD5QVJ9_PARTN|nr:hypothetical protein KIN20_022865 [Parelaphostrongylus tenuis]
MGELNASDGSRMAVVDRRRALQIWSTFNELDLTLPLRHCDESKAVVSYLRFSSIFERFCRLHNWPEAIRYDSSSPPTLYYPLFLPEPKSSLVASITLLYWTFPRKISDIKSATGISSEEQILQVVTNKE